MTQGTSDLATIVEDDVLTAAMHREAAGILAAYGDAGPIAIEVEPFPVDATGDQPAASGGTAF